MRLRFTDLVGLSIYIICFIARVEVEGSRSTIEVTSEEAAVERWCDRLADNGTWCAAEMIDVRTLAQMQSRNLHNSEADMVKTSPTTEPRI